MSFKLVLQVDGLNGLQDGAGVYENHSGGRSSRCLRVSERSCQLNVVQDLHGINPVGHVGRRVERR